MRSTNRSSPSPRIVSPSGRPTPKSTTHPGPQWWSLADEEPISGLQEMRRGALMAYDKETLRDRMTAYFDPKIDWATFAASRTACRRKRACSMPANGAQQAAQKAESFDEATAEALCAVSL